MTGGADERELTAAAAGKPRYRSGARSSTWAAGPAWPSSLRSLAGADAVVVGNTGPAHLAAAVGTAGRVAVRAGRPGRALGARTGVRSPCSATSTPPAAAAGPCTARFPDTPA